MLLFLLVCSLSLAATGQEADNDRIDDMLNYDVSTKTMRKPEPAEYANVPTKRREYTQDSNEVDLTSCCAKVVDQQRQIEEMKEIMFMSQQPTCNPVFKQFLTRLLKEMQRVGLPSDSSEVFYDAKVKLSTQAMAQIQALVEGEDSWRTGALDDAVSQILVDLRPHDYEARKWRFEDTFGVELDTLLEMGLGVLIIVAIIWTPLWSMVSWFIQFWRLFGVTFFVSVIWNWLYLYKIAFAEHERKTAKMQSVYEKCSGVKNIGWIDSFKEWYRITFTLQDDPCKEHYEVLLVKPILGVPSIAAITYTITTLITEPLEYVGQGISKFFVALLKDQPITLQIPVFFAIVVIIVAFTYTVTILLTEPLEYVGQGISKFFVALLKDQPITLQIPVFVTIVLIIVVCMYGGVHCPGCKKLNDEGSFCVCVGFFFLHYSKCCKSFSINCSCP